MVAYTGGLGLGRGMGTLFVSGIPDSSECGANPCGVFDDVSSSAECLQFVQCADPSEFSSWIVGQGGIIPSIGAQLGTEVGGTVSGTVNSAVDSLINSITGKAATNVSGINWTMWIMLGAGVYLIGKVLERR